jgi:hypothetical protein
VGEDADGARGGEGREGAGVADGAHDAGRPPAADEEAEEMRRAEEPDLGRREAELQPRDRVERREAARAELEQDDREEQGGEGDEEAHGNRVSRRADWPVSGRLLARMRPARDHPAERAVARDGALQRARDMEEDEGGASA